MNAPHALSPQSRAILEMMTSYHLERLAQWERTQRAQGPRINLARLIAGLGREDMHGEDREALEEHARHAGLHFDRQRPAIPFTALRDLTVASGTGGGFLHGTQTQEAVDILRPWSVVARAGVQVETGLVGDQVVPRVGAKATPVWLTNEAAQVTPSQPTLGQVALAPKTVGGVVQFSRQLSLQANAERFVRRELSRTIGTALDQAAINGSGASGQPLGIIGTAGVQTQSGTTLNAGVRTMKRKVSEANVDDARIAYISTPEVRELLEGREIVTGSGRFVWDDDEVADRPAYVTTDMPAATMICGDYASVYVGIWGEAFVLEINPFDPTHFRSGVIQARVLLSCDVAVLHPAGFVVASSIT